MSFIREYSDGDLLQVRVGSPRASDNAKLVACSSATVLSGKSRKQRWLD